MRTQRNWVRAASAVALVMAAFQAPQVAAGEGGEMSAVEKGKEIAFDRKKGNCLACHRIEGGTLMGNMGPPLVAMKARFPDKDKLRAMIWDIDAVRPDEKLEIPHIMPPFGKHRILTEEEVDLVTDYVYSL